MKDKVRLGSVVLDLTRYELRRSGCRISIERIPMEVLILLARSGGRLLTRKEIADHLWGKNPWLDTDRNLNTAIGKIRRVLGDHSEKPRFIETAVGKGYRFVAPVRVARKEDGFNLHDEFTFLILDPASEPVAQNANAGSEVPRIHTPASEKDTDQSPYVRLSGRNIVKSSVWVGAAILLFLIVLQVWSFRQRSRHIVHDLDTRVWIKGEWLVGEFRHCQMQTRYDQESENDLKLVEKLPRLFCGEEENGLSEFEIETASVHASPDLPAASGSSPPSSNADLGLHSRRFHVMPVHFLGRVEASDQSLTLWRCKRNSDSLDCKTIN